MFKKFIESVLITVTVTAVAAVFPVVPVVAVPAAATVPAAVPNVPVPAAIPAAAVPILSVFLVMLLAPLGFFLVAPVSPLRLVVRVGFGRRRAAAAAVRVPPASVR